VAERCAKTTKLYADCDLSFCLQCEHVLCRSLGEVSNDAAGPGQMQFDSWVGSSSEQIKFARHAVGIVVKACSLLPPEQWLCQQWLERRPRPPLTGTSVLYLQPNDCAQQASLTRERRTSRPCSGDLTLIRDRVLPTCERQDFHSSTRCIIKSNAEGGTPINAVPPRSRHDGFHANN
jgi:hypothetical protein